MRGLGDRTSWRRTRIKVRFALGMTFGSGPEMSGTPESRLADPNQVIADLQRQVAECKAELDQRTAEHDALRGEPVERPRLHQGLGNTLDLLPTILAPRGGSLSWAGRATTTDQRQSFGYLKNVRQLKVCSPPRPGSA